jgi:hypothetical protein
MTLQNPNLMEREIKLRSHPKRKMLIRTINDHLQRNKMMQ